METRLNLTHLIGFGFITLIMVVGAINVVGLEHANSQHEAMKTLVATVGIACLK